jgi:hypothetical protein
MICQRRDEEERERIKIKSYCSMPSFFVNTERKRRNKTN